MLGLSAPGCNFPNFVQPVDVQIDVHPAVALILLDELPGLQDGGSLRDLPRRREVQSFSNVVVGYQTALVNDRGDGALKRQV